MKIRWRGRSWRLEELGGQQGSMDPREHRAEWVKGVANRKMSVQVTCRLARSAGGTDRALWTT